MSNCKIQRSAEISKASANASEVRCNATKAVSASLFPRGGHIEDESPDHTQRDTNESDNNISSCSTLSIGKKVENLSLETQLHDLSQRLQHSEKQRADLQGKLNECSAEKEVCLRRLEVISAAHECRITEMHCVIAELSKKLRAKQETTILEEQEPEGSEISYQEGSIYNSELNLTNPDAECQTDPLDESTHHSDVDEMRNGEENVCSEIVEDLKINDSSNANKGQVEALQEEVLHLKAQIALLQSEIANSLRFEQDQDNDAAADEGRRNVEFYDVDEEENESLYSTEQLANFAQNSTSITEANITKGSGILLKAIDPITSPQRPQPIAKMAERVKLRCASKSINDNVVSATDLLNAEILEDIVEHLESDLRQNNSLVESFVEPSQLDNELQRLQRKVEHLKVRNTVLSLTLEECKEHCEHLYLLCGKYESNAIALQSAVNCSDRAIEAYDVMLALLESKLALIKDNSIVAEESRKAVESVARHLLDRLESEKNVCENSLGPWQNTFSIPDKVSTPWTMEDDNRLRYHVSKLKGRRSTVQNTIVNLESPFSDFYEKSRIIFDKNKELQSQEKGTQMDLEMAVLMQELLNLREENISLKSKMEEAEKERQYAVEKKNVLEETLKHITCNTNTLFSSEEVREKQISYSEAEHSVLTEQQLVEALTRECQLKGRIQALISSVSASQKISDEKYEQLQNTVKELQKSNLNLTQLLEQNKRKYQLRTRRLEQKIAEMTQDDGQVTHPYPNGRCMVQQSQRLKCKDVIAKPQGPDNLPETTL